MDMQLSIIGYNPTGAWKKTTESVDELLSYKSPHGITWINIDGLENADAINRLSEVHHIHTLTVEDIRDVEQRPKVEEFDDYIFITFKTVNHASKNGFEQISLILMRDTLITFQELPGDSFDPIRRRILDNAGRIRKMGVDYLAYAIIDSMMDEYSLMLDDISMDIETLEERALDENDGAFTPDLQHLKQSLLQMRKVVLPLRESLNILLHIESPLITRNIRPFFKDVHDNVIQTTETIEGCRELLAGVMEISLATMSNRMNKVMKVLTIISTIFIPLTFIVGVYGMNFRFMPELEMRYAYFIVWAIMLAIAVGMIFFFKRRKWLR
ncbi:MAG: magnesium/cobalt transporter CorA [Treponema sp.]|jgi:magnesium transporter|nr:magnesium/cobalt transporter CorA [Treponema sp.]